MSDFLNSVEEAQPGTPKYIEVITCSECKHMNIITKHGMTMQQCSQTSRIVQDYDYCSWAKRKPYK